MGRWKEDGRRRDGEGEGSGGQAVRHSLSPCRCDAMIRKH